MLEAIPHRSAGSADDLFQELLAQVQGAYVRLSDGETVRLAAVCRDEQSQQRDFAGDLLCRNALPIILKAAFDHAARFGGLLEAFDAGLHILNKQLPHGERAGWDPRRNGMRWLAWVTYKVAAELPKEATRSVDEKRQSDAPAAIANARTRLMYGVGNDASLRELRWHGQQAWRSVQGAVRLPRGRKNLVVKRGSGRITRRFLLRGLPLTCRNLQGKVPLGWNGKELVGLPLAFESWPKEVALKQAFLPLSAHWIAAAVRANARELLSRKGLALSTRERAARLLNVNELWVQRNSRALRLDALVGEEQDERLSDILPAVERSEAGQFEVPLHHADLTRAITALKRFGPDHGSALMALPVRQLLPVQRRREQERQEREQYQVFLNRSGLQGTWLQAYQAARYILEELGLDPQTPMRELHAELRGVQSALRGQRPAKHHFAQQLAGALHGTALQTASPADVELAREVRRRYPAVRFTFSVAALIGWQRKLARQGQADRKLVQACTKAGVRIKVATDALNRVQVPTTQRRDNRIRVKSEKPFLRPMQLALESYARSIGARADVATPTANQLEQQLRHLERQAEQAGSDQQWLHLLDEASELRAQATLARQVADQLAEHASALEEAATEVNLGLALRALLEAEDTLDLHEIVQTPQAWWAQAFHACPTNHPAPVAV